MYATFKSSCSDLQDCQSLIFQRTNKDNVDFTLPDVCIIPVYCHYITMIKVILWSRKATEYLHFARRSEFINSLRPYPLLEIEPWFKCRGLGSSCLNEHSPVILDAVTYSQHFKWWGIKSMNIDSLICLWWELARHTTSALWQLYCKSSPGINLTNRVLLKHSTLCQGPPNNILHNVVVRSIRTMWPGLRAGEGKQWLTKHPGCQVIRPAEHAEGEEWDCVKQ